MDQEKKCYVPVGIRLERETARRLRVYAAERMVPMSAVITSLIDRLLAGPTP